MWPEIKTARREILDRVKQAIGPFIGVPVGSDAVALVEDAMRDYAISQWGATREIAQPTIIRSPGNYEAQALEGFPITLIQDGAETPEGTIFFASIGRDQATGEPVVRDAVSLIDIGSPTRLLLARKES